MLLPDDSVACGRYDLMTQAVRVFSRENHRRKALADQYLLPGFRIQTGTARYAQLGVLGQPPSFKQPERQMSRKAVVCHFI
ncbi:hypothetical protein D3C87_856570 [compost metagenome]